MSTMPVLDFVVFYVSNLDESFAYFTEKLGFEPIPEQNGPVFRGLRGNEEKIGFGLNLASSDTPPAGTAELYFKADNLEELHTTLTAKNAGTTPIVHKPFGSIFNIRTPDKHALVMLGE
ncbi:MAG: VOC family protein [Ktedonobacteraceae bacterium]|nr:VOC family protein [Ktedonobacteraceae bacterium]